jgi:PEP-CTERM motif-containing protein
MKKLLLAAAALVALGAAGQAQATCVSSTPISAPDPGAGTTCAITATASTVDVVFAYKSAADVDLLLNGVSLLVSNLDPFGTEATITGLTVGQVLDFVFTNQTTGDSFQAGVAASDGRQHVAVQSTYADFQTDAPRTYLTQADLGAAYGVMTGIAPIGDWTFVGMEDLLANQNSDFDYNDLIFGFLGIDPPVNPVPEPMTLSLLGIGLVGLAAIRRRRAA